MLFLFIVVVYLAVQALSLASLQAIYKAWLRIWTRDYWETNLASGRVEALNPGPPDYTTSTLNDSATLHPGSTEIEII